MYFFSLQQVHYVIYCTFYLIRSVTMGQQLINISLAPYRSCISPNAHMVVANCIGNIGYKKGLLNLFLAFFWRNDLNFVTAHQLPRGGEISSVFSWHFTWTCDSYRATISFIVPSHVFLLMVTLFLCNIPMI